MTTRRQQMAFYRQVDDVCERLSHRLASVLIAGSLTAAQLAHLEIAVTIAGEMRRLFHEEGVRTGRAPRLSIDQESAGRDPRLGNQEQ